MPFFPGYPIMDQKRQIRDNRILAAMFFGVLTMAPIFGSKYEINKTTKSTELIFGSIFKGPSQIWIDNDNDGKLDQIKKQFPEAYPYHTREYAQKIYEKELSREINQPPKIRVRKNSLGTELILEKEVSNYKVSFIDINNDGKLDYRKSKNDHLLILRNYGRSRNNIDQKTQKIYENLLNQKKQKEHWRTKR